MEALGRLGGFVDCAPQRPTSDRKESDPMVFVLCGDQHLCRVSVQPNAGTGHRILTSVPRCWDRRFVRIRCSPRPGIDLERPKLGGHVQASFR